MSVDGFITLVQQQQKSPHRFNIFVDDHYAFSVHENVLVKHRLIKGQRIDQNQVHLIIEDEEQQKAYSEALRFIGRRPRSIKEVRMKLTQKEYESSVIDWVINRLTEQKYIDDEQFAKLWTDHRILSHKKGRRWVRQELLQKGISREHITYALEQLDEEDEYRSAYQVAVKKWNTQKDNSQQSRQRVAAFLQRRGFSNSVVRRVLIELKDQQHKEETE
jgi:regulatory protein